MLEAFQFMIDLVRLVFLILLAILEFSPLRFLAIKALELTNTFWVVIVSPAVALTMGVLCAYYLGWKLDHGFLIWFGGGILTCYLLYVAIFPLILIVTIYPINKLAQRLWSIYALFCQSRGVDGFPSMFGKIALCTCLTYAAAVLGLYTASHVPGCKIDLLYLAAMVNALFVGTLALELLNGMRDTVKAGILLGIGWVTLAAVTSTMADLTGQPILGILAGLVIAVFTVVAVAPAGKETAEQNEATTPGSME